MKTFSAMWTDKLGEAVKAASVEPYPMEFHQGSDDFDALCAAVNQGIDAHLEAVFYSEFAGEHGRRGFLVSADTLPVLVRRLMESGDENSENLASAICGTLGIELI